MKLKHLACWATFIGGIIFISSCSKSFDDNLSNVDLIPVKISEKGKWSFINSKGEIIYEDEFKNEPSVAYNGFFSVEEEDGYSVYKVGPKSPEIIKNLEKLKSVGYFEDKLIPVTFPKSRITIVNASGDIKFELAPINGTEITHCNSSFSEGRLLFSTEDNKHGYYDTKGNVVIEPKYDKASYFSEGLAVVGIKQGKDDDTKLIYSIIDKEGETIFKIKEGYSLEVKHYQSGYLLLSKDDRLFLYNKKGEEIKLPSKITNVQDYNEKYIIFRTDGEYGVADINGEVIIRPKYSELYFDGTDRFIAQKNEDDKELIRLNSEGEEIGDKIDYEECINFGKFGYIAKEGKTFLLLDDKFKKKGKNEFFRLGTRRTASWLGIVSSDYFDMSAASKDVVSQINGNKVCGLTLGASVANIMTNKQPKDYTFQTQLDLKDSKIEGFRYTINPTALFTGRMADYEWRYYSNNYYYWNENCYLGAINFKLNTQSEWGKEGQTTMTDAFTSAGFKVIKKNSLKSLLKKGNILVIVVSDDNSCNIVVADSSIQGFSGLEEQWASTIIQDEDNSKPYIHCESDSAVVVEEAIAEEVAVVDSAYVGS